MANVTNNLFVNPTIYKDIANIANHMLITGATGSGKSVMLNGIINAILYKDPAKNRLVLIDPKKVELSPYATTKHCLGYADTPESIEKLLKECLD